MHVETQGSAGSTPLPLETIAAADAVIFAIDVGVNDRARFAGKPVISSGVKRPSTTRHAMSPKHCATPTIRTPPRVEGRRPAVGTPRRRGAESWGGRTRRVLMTGASYIIPFVAAGGLLIALGFLFGGYEIVGPYGEIAVNNTIFNLPDPRPWAWTTRCSTRASSPTSARCSSSSARPRSRSSSRRWPATSPTPSPTGRASRPGS